MAPLADISHSLPDTAGKILDEIEVQFKLDDVALTRITTQFLQEIAEGLAEYGRPMAIMYVQPVSKPGRFTLIPPLVIQPYFRRRSAIGQGEGVSDAPSRKLLPRHAYSHHRRPSPAPSSLLISEEPICKLSFPCSRKSTPLMPYMISCSRVCEVNLNGDQTFSLRQQKYKVSEQLKTGEATALFGEPLTSNCAIVLALRSSLEKKSRLPCRLCGRLPDFLRNFRCPGRGRFASRFDFLLPG